MNTDERENVIYLPDRDATNPAEPTADPEVIEGEIVTDEEYTRLTSQRGQAIARYQGYGRDLATAARLARKAATHDRTVATSKALARHACYPFAGAGVVAKRWRDTHGASRYERMMRTAEAAGNWEEVKEWEARDVAEKQRRHQRVMDWITSPVQLVKAGSIGIASVTGLLLVLGIVLAFHNSDPSLILAPITSVLDAIAFTWWFLTAYGLLLLVCGTVGGLAYLWHVGRLHTDPPRWFAPSTATDGRDVVPDEGAILNALRNLGLPPLDRKLKEGWSPRWVQGTGRDGKGWRTQLELPPGVTVEMIGKKRDVLAHNLVRLPVEVWPTEPKRQPGVLDLWVADQGLLTSPVPAWPLLTEGTADYFAGVPVAIDQRGDAVTGKLMAANYAAAGIMGSGKTSLVVNLLLGAMLDPLVDIDVFVMAFNADYDPMRPRLRTLVKGDEDEQITAAIAALRELRAEVTERGKILAEKGGDETKLTRAIAEADPRMRPRVVVFDECQELFRHESLGEEAKELAIKVMMKARKCGITLIFVTPAPSADSLPRDLAKTVSHRVCFAIGDHQGNDAILGTGAHRAGITATGLVAGEDIGTAMASGFAARPGLLRTYFIKREKGTDEVTPIVQRALALREDAGITAAQAPAAIEAADEPDPLADIAAVLDGRARMRTQEVLQRLAERNPAHYRSWSFSTLTALLGEYGIAPRKSGGNMVVRAADLTEAITERDELADTDDADDEPAD